MQERRANMPIFSAHAICCCSFIFAFLALEFSAFSWNCSGPNVEDLYTSIPRRRSVLLSNMTPATAGQHATVKQTVFLFCRRRRTIDGARGTASQKTTISVGFETVLSTHDATLLTAAKISSAGSDGLDAASSVSMVQSYIHSLSVETRPDERVFYFDYRSAGDDSI